MILLGDRVVIMAHGKAHCNGSPLFLKRILGDGYTLSMNKGRVSEKMSCEKSVICFSILANVSHIRQNNETFLHISTKIRLKKVISTEVPGCQV